MRWKEIILLLFLVQTVSLAKEKRRRHKREDKPDPLLSEIFKSTLKDVGKAEEKRPDRSISPDEELEALLAGFQKRKKQIFHPDPIKRESGPEPTQNGIVGQDQLMMLNAQDPNDDKRNKIYKKPNAVFNANQIPSMQNAQFAPDTAKSLMQQSQILNQQQALLNGMAAASLTEASDQDNNQLQGRSYIPGRPSQQRNDWGSKPGVTVYLHADKKSTIPIPVKTEASNAPNPGSFPLQMRRISPNMEIGSIVPHQAEFGETVESVTKKPEELLAKKSEIPHPSDSKSKKSEVSKSKKTKNGTVNEKSEKASKKDWMQQPLMSQQQVPQQQMAFQTTSQLAANQVQNNPSFNFPAPSVEEVTGAPCVDQYDQCPDFAKNEYCAKYPEQMSLQCRRSCKYCVAPAIPVVNVKQQLPNITEAAVVASGSGSGDSSGSGDVEEIGHRRSSIKNVPNTHAMYLPELGSGSGSGSGDDASGGGESEVVRQLASAQNIVSGVGQQATTNQQDNTMKKSNIPSFKKSNKQKILASKLIKKSSIPQSPVSPLTAMDTENVDDDGDTSGSASGSGSGDYSDVTARVGKSSIAKFGKKGAKNSNKIAKNAKNISKTNKNVKKSSVPVPLNLPKFVSAYPKIDLRKIASALARYEEAALTLVGEYPRVDSTENDVITRSQIPHPGGLAGSPFNKLRQNIQIAKLVTQDSQKRFQIPKYLLVGDQINEKDGVNTDRSTIPDADSYESVAQRFQVPGVKPSLEELYAETGKSSLNSEAAKRTKISKKKKKIQKPVDPFEYLRNMEPGASMEPIVDPHAKSSVRESVSYPVYLMKVMPGSHKYAAAAARSKVIPNPKKPAAAKEEKQAQNPEQKHVVATQAKTPVSENRVAQNQSPQPKYELSPVPVMNNFAASQPETEANFQTVIETGPAKFPEPQAAANVGGFPSNSVPINAAQFEPAPNNGPLQSQQAQSSVGNAREEQPSLRTKMLSAFFHNKAKNEAFASGSGSDEFNGSNVNTRQTIWGTGSLIPEQPMVPQPMPEGMNFYGK